MVEILKDVGTHDGTWGNGHYEATVHDDGSVVIKTILEDATHSYTVKLTTDQWNRLAGWVAWAQGKWKKE